MSKRIEIVLGDKPGAQGFQGWSPVLSATANGTNVVLKVTDWVGGFGVKPAINVFVTAGGYTTDINAATNIRGSGAVEPGDNVILAGGANIVAKNHSCYLTESGANRITIPAVSQAMGFDCRAIVRVSNTFSISISNGQKLYNASSRSLGSAFENISFPVNGLVGPTIYQYGSGIYEVRCFNDGSITHIYVF